MTSRLFEILYVLLERRQVCAQELAGRLGVSVRTIYRDVVALSEAGIPVYATQGRGGGIALMEGFSLARAALSEGEKDALLMAVKGFAAASPEDARSALAKLSGLFERGAQDWIEVDLSAWGAAGQKDERFTRLREAIRRRLVVTFTYRSSYGLRRTRRVKPARLAFKAAAWYLQGKCCEKDAYRTFRLTRMTDVCVTDEGFADDLSHVPAIDIAYWGDAPVEPVVLRVRSACAFRAMDEFAPGQIEENPDGSLTVRTASPLCGDFIAYLLSYGDALEVLSPAHARAALRAAALNVAKIYEPCDQT